MPAYSLYTALLAVVLTMGVGCGHGAETTAVEPTAVEVATAAETVHTVTMTTRSPAGEVRRLTSYLTGRFSSAAQAEADSSYFDIRLHVAPIWPDRADGPWLYVEQAAASALDRPYRQRVYHVSQQPDGTLVSAVYELPGDPLRFAGAWATPEAFADVEPGDLVARTGCAVYLQPDDTGRFVGATDARACISTLRGAAYATSEVEIGPDGMTSWDRGYAADGTQVWGAVEGAYRFDRIDG